MLFRQLEERLAEITGFAGVSLQPNAGRQGEFAGTAGDPRLSRSRAAKPSQRVPDPQIARTAPIPRAR